LAADGVFFDVFVDKKTTLEKALQRYSITEEQFYENMPYKDMLTFAETPLEELQKKWHNFTKEKHEKYKACKNKFETCQMIGTDENKLIIEYKKYIKSLKK
jgi:hypothetical protein